MKTVSRYFRSPEFVLAVVNAALMVFLFGYEYLEPLIEPLDQLLNMLSLSATAQSIALLALLLPALATIMLPFAFVYILAGVTNLVDISDSVVVAWVGVANAPIWAFLVAFLFRLIRSGSAREARAATLRWSVRGKVTPRVPCPHCGQLMPAPEAAPTGDNDEQD